MPTGSQLKLKVSLAPMHGVTDAIMREILTELNPFEFTVTEFVRVSHSLLPKSVFLKVCPELLKGSRTPSGTLVKVQLLGGDPELMAENAAFLACELGAKAIDLNFGCPAPTVNRHDGGAVILKSPERVQKIVGAVHKALPESCSLSVKIRLGYDSRERFQDNVLAALSSPISALTIHARTRKDLYQRPAHWEWIGLAKSLAKSLAPEVEVLANGDIRSFEDAVMCSKITGCDHLMIGRGALMNPWLGREIAVGAIGQASDVAMESLVVLQLFLSRSSEVFGEPYAVARAKQWSRYMAMSKNEILVKAFESLKTCQTQSEIENRLKPFLEAQTPQRPSGWSRSFANPLSLQATPTP